MSRHGPTNACIAELRAAYETVRRLRAAQLADPAFEATAEIQALASKHPGMLRVLERLPPGELDRRIDELRAIRDPSTSPPWMRCAVSFHGWMRASLRVRSTARGALEPVVVVAKGYVAGPDEPSLEEWNSEALSALLAPPEGRMTTFVLGRVAAEQGLPTEEVERLVFGVAHSRGAT
ncbi:MAG: hypothetical protein R3A78_14195 [Polyangiales bacterium]|nr:hypothetical protein [Myxococcales bacterium]